MVQNCGNCGSALQERSKFCPGCGEPRLAEAVAAAGQVLMSDAGPVTLDLNTPSVPPADEVTRDFPKPMRPDVSTYANFGKRFNALVFDVLLLLILIMASTFVLSLVSKKSIFSSNSMLLLFYSVSIVIFALTFIVLPARRGQTLGKRLTGIRIVKADGEYPGILTMVLRHVVGYLVSSAGGMLGFLWAAWDRKHQGWHDKIAHTIVVDA